MDITPIPAFQDNYIWAMHNKAGHCVLVDPGDAAVVEKFLQKQNLQLSAILITHHHWDHTGGVQALCAQRNIPVYGPHNPNIEGIQHPLSEGDTVHLPALDLSFQILEVPGHTLDHIAYYNADQNLLFCGDTLFHAGCGRLFEGSPEQMLSSLNKLAALPNQTQVFCTHEYTLANLAFAQAVEPDNTQLANTVNHVQQLRDAGKVSLPSDIGLQRQINPFLRSEQVAVIQAAKARGSQSNEPAEIFKTIRQWKDSF